MRILIIQVSAASLTEYIMICEYRAVRRRRRTEHSLSSVRLRKMKYRSLRTQRMIDFVGYAALVLGLLSCRQPERMSIDCAQLSATFSGSIYMTYSRSAGHHTMSRALVSALDSSHFFGAPPFFVSYTHMEITLELLPSYLLCSIEYTGTTTRRFPWDRSPWCTSFTFYPESLLSPLDTIFLSFTYTRDDGP